MRLIFCLLSLLCVISAQASAPKVPIAYTNAPWRQAEFEKDQQGFIASGKRYKNIRRSTGTEGGGSYGHWFYKKLDGSITHSFDENSGFSDERDAWLFHAYAHNDSIDRLAFNGWAANHATVDSKADSLLKKLEQDVTTPAKRTATNVSLDNGSMKITVDNSPAITDWLAERLASKDEGVLFQQLFVGLWRKRDKTLVDAIDNAQKEQEDNRAGGEYLNPEQNKKIAQEAGCDCERPGECGKTKWKISRFENAALYEHTIRNRKIPLGVFPAWIQMNQGNFRISKSALAGVQQSQGTLFENFEKAKALSFQGAPGGPGSE